MSVPHVCAHEVRPLPGDRALVRTGKPLARNVDYDVPFVLVPVAPPPSRTGTCMPHHWVALGAARRERHGPKTEAVHGAPAEPGTLLPGGGPPTAPRP
ncbi:hypothetical protein [Streptomyces sp. 142MFCol3.1]|uniref:hypothetical protein n=1 Tax=Streptomyces sp. 142MFCol3.1 TaxID=1172179 RepID=UPI00040BE3F4|nr:hypothetical protein [Streptomyces sp. 142MFCol3.1]